MIYFLTAFNERTKQMKRIIGFPTIKLLRAELCLLLARGRSFEEVDMEDVDGHPIKWEKAESLIAAEQIVRLP